MSEGQPNEPQGSAIDGQASAIESSGPEAIQVRLALGHDPLDRRADLRAGGWGAVPEPRVLLLLDHEGAAAIRRAPDRSVSLAAVPSDSDTGGTLATLDTADVLAPDAADARDSRDARDATTARDAGSTPETLDILLGADESGRLWCGRVVARDDAIVPADVEWAGLRDIALRLPAEERSIFAEFLALANWHATHVRCPRCGAATVVAGLGWWRTCPADGSEHYPRTDPAVIALLVDDEGNALLGRQTRWPEGAFSTLAGFVEPGESAESAVAREIAEEVGLPVTGARYVGSQPWPFPASLMLGYHATISGVRPEPQPDGVEIAEARWISRAELPALCESREVRLPGRLSIAHHLVRLWYGQELPPEWCRW